MSEQGAGAQPPALGTRIAGGLLVLGATCVIALLESFLVVLRWGSVHLPVSLVLVLVFHPLLTRLMRDATRSRIAMLGPLAGWLLVVLPLSLRRAEGDLIITGRNWVASALLFGGLLVYVVSVGLLMPVRPPRGGSLGGDGAR